MSSLTEEIDFNLAQIQQLIDKSSPVVNYCKLQTPDFVYCSAIGSILHSFYNGIEKIFLLINKNY